MPISDYLRGLRTKVGTDLLLCPAVTMVLRDEAGRVLLARHADNQQWALPGGSVDPDETPADTAMRELWEEAGVLAVPERILGVYGGPDFMVTYPNGDQIASVDTVFACRIVEGVITADQEEIHELRYFTQAETHALALAPWVKVVLTDLWRGDTQASFQPPVWQLPTDGVRKGGMSDYVRQLRQRIGTDLLLAPTVGALVFNDRGDILLQQRGDTKQWSIPAGALDPVETPADGVLREVWEETGLLVMPERLVGVYGGPQLRHTHPNGDQAASILNLFTCRPVDDRPPSPDGRESLDARFFPVAAALTILPERWQRRLQSALAGHAAVYFQPATWHP